MLIQTLVLLWQLSVLNLWTTGIYCVSFQSRLMLITTQQERTQTKTQPRVCFLNSSSSIVYCWVVFGVFYARLVTKRLPVFFFCIRNHVGHANQSATVVAFGSAFFCYCCPVSQSVVRWLLHRVIEYVIGAKPSSSTLLHCFATGRSTGHHGASRLGCPTKMWFVMFTVIFTIGCAIGRTKSVDIIGRRNSTRFDEGSRS